MLNVKILFSSGLYFKKGKSGFFLFTFVIVLIRAVISFQHIHIHRNSILSCTLTFKVDFAVLSPNLLGLANAFNLFFLFCCCCSTYPLSFCRVCIFLRVKTRLIHCCFSLKHGGLNTNMSQREQVLKLSTVTYRFIK